MGWLTDIKSLFINPDSAKCAEQRANEDEKHKKNVLEENNRHEDITAKEVLRHKNAVIDIESNAVCVEEVKPKVETKTTDGSSLMESNSSNSNASVNPNEIKLEGVATAPATAPAVGGRRRSKRKNHAKKRKNTKRIR